MDQKLQKGQTAPDFKTTDIHGNHIQLRDFSGQKLLISFQRGVMCPFCNLRVHYLNKNYEEHIAHGMKVLVVTESTPETVLQSSLFSRIRLPVVADPDRDLYRLFQVENSLLKLTLGMLNTDTLTELWRSQRAGRPLVTETGTSLDRIPAEFLIDEKSVIYEAYYGSSVADHIPGDVVETFLKKTSHVGAAAEK